MTLKLTSKGVRINPAATKIIKTSARRQLEAEARQIHERALETLLRADGIAFEAQVQLLPEELPRYRWDFAVYDGDGRIVAAVEVNGSIWQRGGHNTGTGLLRDYAKQNTLLALRGIPTIVVAPEHIASGQASGWIKAAIERGSK